MTSTVLLTGGTGLIGGALLRRLTARAVQVRALGRSAGRLADVPHTEELRWDGIRPPDGALDGVDAVVHLSGEPIFGGLPTAARKERLRASRVESTRALVGAMAALPEEDRPRTFVCASAVGYYGDRGEETLSESAEPGSGLLADLCVDWEAAAAEATRLGVRVCHLRIGVVLSAQGGALALMLKPFRLGVGGRIGGGKQWFPWVHLDDVVGMLETAVDSEAWEGPVNGVAPEPVRHDTLVEALGRLLHRPTWFGVPGFAVRALLGEIADELLGSKRVVPARAQELGFAFRHPDLEGALRAEIG